MRRGTCCGAVQESGMDVVKGTCPDFGGVGGCGSAFTRTGGALLPFPCNGQTQMSSGGVVEAVAELLPPSCITAGRQGTRGQRGGSLWLWGLDKPLQAVWEQDGGSVAGPEDAQGR